MNSTLRPAFRIRLIRFGVGLLLIGSMRAQEASIAREAVDLKTEDGQSLLALKYSNGAKNPVWGGIIMHPAGDARRDWRLPYFARAGVVALGMSSRYLNDVAHEYYEAILLDLAAGVRYLREVEHVQKVFLVGHSGGGSLVTFYAQQSARKPGDRMKEPFSGQPVDWRTLGFESAPGPTSVLRPVPDLNRFQLPPVDLLILSSAHYGAGWALVRKIDPSVTDEGDPASLDPELDMYNPDNGYKTPPQASKYTEKFLEKYRAAQEARAWRLMRQAQSYVDEKKAHERLMAAPAFKSLPLYDQIRITRKAVTQRYMVIYRLLAIPNFLDLSLEPTDRVVGSNSTLRPDQGNYNQYFHPAFITPESLLSAEGPTSPIHILTQIKEVSIPTLFICGTADMQEYPSEREEMLKASGAKVKELVWIEGANHPYLPSGPKAGDGRQRDRAAKAMLDFIRKAYPGALDR